MGAMPAGFESEGKVLLADFWANEKIQHFYTNRCDRLDARLTSWSMTFMPLPPPKSKSWRE
jgi:hypothetical protein